MEKLHRIQTCALLSICVAAGAPAALAGDRDGDMPAFERSAPETRAVTVESAKIEFDLTDIEFVHN